MSDLDSAIPSPATVLRGLALFLEQDLRHRVDDKGAAFRARIAAHLLSVIATETEEGGARAQADADAWAGLLGEATVPLPQAPAARRAALAARETRLCTAIRTGEVDAEAARAPVLARLQAELAVQSPMFDPRAAGSDDDWGDASPATSLPAR